MSASRKAPSPQRPDPGETGIAERRLAFARTRHALTQRDNHVSSLLFFPSHMKCFYRLRHREIEKLTRSITLRLPMAFWLSVLVICLLEAIAVIVAIRRERLGKEKSFTVDEMRR
jgi:hypothetical protein